MAQWEIFANHCLKLYYLVVELLLLLPVILQFLFPLLGGGHGAGGASGPSSALVAANIPTVPPYHGEVLLSVT